MKGYEADEIIAYFLPSIQKFRQTLPSNKLHSYYIMFVRVCRIILPSFEANRHESLFEDLNTIFLMPLVQSQAIILVFRHHRPASEMPESPPRPGCDSA